MPLGLRDAGRDGGAGVPVHAGGQRRRRRVGTKGPRLIVNYRYAPDDPEAVIEEMAAPTTRVVSLT